MTRTNRITTYEIKQFLKKAFDIVGYNTFVVKDLEEKMGIDARRISYILLKASYHGLCKNTRIIKYPFKYKGITTYRYVNEYAINKPICRISKR